eukprot:scaffold215715_cov22-Prasinocladus_malaysianus.AAC.1
MQTSCEETYLAIAGLALNCTRQHTRRIMSSDYQTYGSCVPGTRTIANSTTARTHPYSYSRQVSAAPDSGLLKSARHAQSLQCGSDFSKGYVWDAEELKLLSLIPDDVVLITDAHYLRRKRRISGVMRGGLTKYRQQTGLCSLPMELTGEEVSFLLLKGFLDHVIFSNDAQEMKIQQIHTLTRAA